MAALGHIKGPSGSAAPVCLMAARSPGILSAQGAEGLSGGKRKERRRQWGEDPGGSWDTAPRVSASRSRVSHGFLGPTFFWPSLVCTWSAAHSPALSSFSAPPGRHFCKALCVHFHKHLSRINDCRS